MGRLASVTDDKQLDLILACHPKSVAEAREAVGTLARLGGAPVIDVKIAVSEAVGNAVVHVYRNRDPGSITVLARYERGRFLVTVADDGIGMMPDPDSPGLGYGIPMIMQLCDDVRFRSSAAGTIVSMSFPARTPPG
jgi:anti-sigma regulatory factor (Ser/Thr protein kinase)